MNEELITKIKEAIFSGEYRLCDNAWWCPNRDGYCPKYTCGQLDKIRSFTDRQWENALKYAKKQYKTENWTLDDLIDVLLNEYLINKRPTYCKNKNLVKNNI